MPLLNCENEYIIHLYCSIVRETGFVHLHCSVTVITVLNTGAKPHSQDGDGRGATRGVAAGAGGPRPGAQRPPAAGADPRPRGGQQPRRPRAGLTSSPYNTQQEQEA